MYYEYQKEKKTARNYWWKKERWYEQEQLQEKEMQSTQGEMSSEKYKKHNALRIKERGKKSVWVGHEQCRWVTGCMEYFKEYNKQLNQFIKMLQ